MKRFSKLGVCVLAVLVAFVAIPVNWILADDYPQRDMYEARNGTVTIDGTISAAWLEVSAEPIDRVFENTGEGDESADGEFRILWDDEYIYILVVVNDSTPIVFYDEDVGNNAHDGLEFRLSAYDTDATEYNIQDHFRFILSRNGRISTGMQEDRAQYILDSIQFAIEEDDEQYVVELAVPMARIFDGFEFQEGTIFGFDLHINDAVTEEPGRDFAIGWNDAGNNVWHNPSLMGTVRLNATRVVAQPEATPEPEETPEPTPGVTPTPRPTLPPQNGGGIDTTLIIIIAAAVIVVGAGVVGFVVIKKKK